MSKKEIEVHVDKDNKIDFKEFIEMKIKYDEEYFKKDKEIERLNNIIKEVREYIEKHQCCDGKINVMTLTEYKELLEILDKVGSDKE